MFSFNAGSVMLISGIVCGLSFVFLLSIIKTHYPKSINGTSEWICACIALSITLLMYSGIFSLGPVVEIFVGRFLFLIGMALVCLGFRHFAERKTPARFIVVSLIIYTLAVTTVKVFGFSDVVALFLTMSLAIAFTLDSLRIVRAFASKSLPETCVSISLCLFSIVFLFRILFLYIDGSSNPLLSIHIALRLYTAGFIACFVGLIGSILLLLAKRLRRTLELAEVYHKVDTEQRAIRWRIGEDLLTSIARNELEVHYQPRVDVHTSKIVSIEALIRWQHPVNGYMRPDQFISIAEENGFIHILGAWVLHKSIEFAAFLRKEKFDIRVSINVSAKQLTKKGFVDFLKDSLSDAGIEPRMIELELTESIAIEDSEGAIATLRQLRQLGLKLSIDDFGTGYSSLSYLSRLPITCLKIDRSFVHDVTYNSDARTVIRGIIRLSSNLGLRTVAEGVESQAQLELLRNEGIHEYQGYLFSRPICGDSLTALLAKETLARQ